MLQFVSLYEAKTRLPGLVDGAAAGEEIIIAKNGVPQARLVPIAFRATARIPANTMRSRRIAADSTCRTLPFNASSRARAGEPAARHTCLPLVE